MDESPGISPWKRACRDFGVREGVDEVWLRRLDAFGRPEEIGTDRLPVGEDGAFEAVEETVVGKAMGLAEQVPDRLKAEVDAHQAELFARRLVSVQRLLDGLAPVSATARILRVGMNERVDQILGVTRPSGSRPPRALRLRAVVDYYFSLAAVLHHAQRRGREGVRSSTIPDLVDAMTWSNLTAGVRWGRLVGETHDGPLRATVLEVSADGNRLRAMDRRGDVARGESLPETVEKAGAIAGVSGGYFLYSEPDIVLPNERFEPVGLLIQEGAVVSPPVFGRSALLQLDSGRFAIARVGLQGVTVTGGLGAVSIKVVNDASALGKRVAAFNRAYGDVAPAGAPQLAIAAGQVCGWSSGQTGLPIPLHGYVVCLCAGSENAVGGLGERVVHRIPRVEGHSVVSAMGGGPELVCEGKAVLDLAKEQFRGTAPPRTFSGDETGDCNLLPRMGAGLRPDGVLVFVAVDGRNFERSLGLTLAGTADVLIALGCHTAMNLDGGSSKRMVFHGSVQDLSTTEVVGGESIVQSVRPVRSAVLIVPADGA